MADAAKKTAAPKKEKQEKVTRKRLSPAERVAKMEADLAAARKQADEANSKKADGLKEQRAKLQAQVDERKKKIAELDTELERLEIPVVNTEEQVDPIVGDQS